MWVIEKAKELMDQRPKIKYVMGADDLVGFDQSLDCSAYIWRCHGQRKFDNKVWRNTSWLWNDVENRETHFDKVNTLEEAQQGDIIVYGWSKGKAGHVAIIDKVDSKGNITGYDCSSSRGGVSYRSLNFFKKKDYRIGRWKLT